MDREYYFSSTWVNWSNFQSNVQINHETDPIESFGALEAYKLYMCLLQRLFGTDVHMLRSCGSIRDNRVENRDIR